MKRILLIVLATVIVVGVGFGIWLELQKPDESGFEPATVTIVPLPEEVVPKRFPDLTEESVRAAQDRGLAQTVWAFAPPLTELIKPGIRAETRRQRGAFLIEQTKEYFEQHPDEAVQRATEAWLHHLIYRGEYSNRRVLVRLQEILDGFGESESNSPLIKLIRADQARRSGKKSDAQKLLKGLPEAFADSEMPAVLNIFASQLEIGVNSEKETLRKREDQLISFALDFLLEHSANSDVHGFAWEVIEDTLDQMSSAGDGRLVSRAVQESEVPDFLVHMLVGEYFREQAWDERGGGYANTVGHSGWHFFEQHMTSASLHFRQAWSLRPDLPFAAQRMIMVAEAHGDEWSARDWFDLAVDAQFDLDSAYDSYLHTIKPRWGGSTSDMLKFGYECASTKDYSSEVGNYIYRVVDAITEEIAVVTPPCTLRPADFRGIFEDEELRRELTSHWQNVDKAIETGAYKDPERILMAYARRAACAMAMDEFETLQKCLERLDKAEHYNDYLPFCADRVLQRSLAYAVVSDQREQVTAIERRFGSDFQGDASLEEIAELHRQLEDLSPKLPEKAQFWVQRVRKKTEILKSYLSDQWVSLTFDDLSVWNVFGKATVENDTTVTVRQVGGSGIYPAPRVEPYTPFPPPYKVIATVEPLEADTPRPQSVGIDLGTAVEPTMEGGCFICAMTRPPGGGVCSRYPEIQQSYEIVAADFVTDIRVNAWSNYYEAQYDDYSLPIPVHRGFRAGNFLSFGACRALKDQGSVRISNVRIHRLPKRPDPNTTTADEVAAYHEAIVQMDPNDRVQVIRLADARILQKRFRDARELLNGIREPDGDGFMTWPTVARIFIGIGAFDEAKRQLEQMISTNPADFRLQQLLAWVLATAPKDELRNGPQAQAIAQQLVAMEPQNWSYQLVLSAAAAECGDTRTAAAAFRTCRSAASGNLVASTRLAEIESWRDGDGKIRLRAQEDQSVSKPEPGTSTENAAAPENDGQSSSQ